MTTIRGQFHQDRNAYIAADEPMILHCHHYNCFLQSSIESAADYIDVYSILADSAQEVVFHQLNTHFSGITASSDERKKIAEDLHKFAGFGTLDLSNTSEGKGSATSPWNHYVEGWITKFGLRKPTDKGVALFTAGFIAGALDAIYDKPLGFHGSAQTSCKSKGETTNSFAVSVANKTNLSASKGQGKYTQFNYENPQNSSVNYVGIREALIGLPIEGNDDGAINAFGVLLTRMYANYYTAISYKYLKAMEAEIGEMGTEIAEELLIESGHVCAFHTFGGIMESNEWNALIKPTLNDKADWVHGITACLNALGWGKLEVIDLVPNEKLVLRVHSGYELNYYLNNYESSERPKAMFKTGAAAGIMNLIYHGDITTNPELTPEYYNKVFKTEGRFVGKQTKCRSLGDDYDEFVAERIK